MPRHRELSLLQELLRPTFQCVETCLQGITGNSGLDLLITGGAETKGHTRSKRSLG